MNKPTSSVSGSGRDNAREADTSNSRTPNADMQPEDAGTDESADGGRAEAVESAMKQTSKTPSERDSGTS
ncbi:MAG TPA: hypothetical protein VK996_04280 [Ramlibacter sp.]|nr:hypothetical protein [Ramlibacter sp.]